MERLFDKVLVTGGAGYCGARLVPQMLARGYKVTVYDIMFFGNQFLPRDNPNLRIIDGDIRDAAKFAAAVAGHDAVVNLACISNDASFELDEDLSTSINLNAFEPLVVAAKKAGVRRRSAWRLSRAPRNRGRTRREDSPGRRARTWTGPIRRRPARCRIWNVRSGPWARTVP